MLIKMMNSASAKKLFIIVIGMLCLKNKNICSHTACFLGLLQIDFRIAQENAYSYVLLVRFFMIADNIYNQSQVLTLSKIHSTI